MAELLWKKARGHWVRDIAPLTTELRYLTLFVLQYCSDEDGEITIVLQKAEKGSTWDAALLGRGGQGIVDPFTKQAMQKKIMLERFQEEVSYIH